MVKKLVIPFMLSLLLLPRVSFALGGVQYVEDKPSRGSFAIVQKQKVAPIYVDSADYAGVVRAAADLRVDIGRVTQQTPTITNAQSNLGNRVILTGTLGKSRLIDRLVREKKIDATSISGKWEAFLVQVVPNPLPGVASGLVIAGSDKRGTIYGIYDLSQQIGVSPWNWWADVPVKRKDALFVKAGKFGEGEPAVKYRGIFINDEEPALGNWTRQKFGGVNSKMYVHMFELLLRLKANYLWPAMWGKSLTEDDPLSAKLADEYGIVIGTSHHEPLMRAQSDWTRGRSRYGNGQWNYITNAEGLRQFWTEGARRNKNYETLTTIGMRGDGDEPMMADADAATKLMETIVADQRKIIAQEINPNVEKVPQLWALYKEVQEYYEKGMRVPDDVTLLWCDDNWGNIRRLPTAEERNRKGGAGIYYHFDYVGGPRSYKWLNTNPIPKIWEQMNLAHQHGADRIWIVNVGDLKPMELPIEFFLDFARAPKQWPKEKLSSYTHQWAAREFGPIYATEIADIVDKYTKYNGRRKPELLEPNTFSFTNYNEADRISADWKAITDKAEQINAKLPAEARDAFFQLVLYPTKASAIVNELYIAAGKNALYASQGRASTSDMAAQVRALFRADADLSAQYHQISGGKWNHMMDQTRIGFTTWSDPKTNIMPAVKGIELPAAASMGVAVEGSSEISAAPTLPTFDALNRQTRWIEVFNRGQAPFAFSATPSAPWLKVSAQNGTVEKETRLLVSVDWSKAPSGTSEGSLRIVGAGAGETTVKIQALNPPKTALQGFVEANGTVSMEAEHFTRKVDSGAAKWEKIDGLGRTLSAMTIFPPTAPAVMPPQNAPRLEYQMQLLSSGKVEVESLLAPTLDFTPGQAMRFAISFDDEAPQVVELPRQTNGRAWNDAVRNGVHKLKTTHNLARPGTHTLKVWMVDPGVVLQKLVVNLGGVKPSYLGPPESYRVGNISSVAFVPSAMASSVLTNYAVKQATPGEAPTVTAAARGAEVAPTVTAPTAPRRRFASAATASPRNDPNSVLAHEQLVAKAKAGGIDLYFLGDSITRRWGTSDAIWAKNLENWKQNFFGWNAGNFGWGADSIQNVLWRIQNGELDGVNPKVIVILAGTNNVGSNPGGDAKVADIVRGIRALIDTCRQKVPDAKIILTAIFPRNDNSAVLPEIAKINDEIAKFADGKTLFYLNVNDKLASPDGTLKEGMSNDKLHLTVQGYQVWADGLRPLLVNLLGPPATTDHAPPPTGDPSAAKPAPSS